MRLSIRHRTYSLRPLWRYQWRHFILVSHIHQDSDVIDDTSRELLLNKNKKIKEKKNGIWITWLKIRKFNAICNHFFNCSNITKITFIFIQESELDNYTRLDQTRLPLRVSIMLIKGEYWFVWLGLNFWELFLFDWSFCRLQFYSFPEN